MKQAIQYLALDVHQATVVATVRDERGSILMRATVPTEAQAILRLVRSAGPRVHVAFEEGTQAQWLHDLIVPHAERLVVCNTRGRSKSGNKSDRIDADGLSELYPRPNPHDRSAASSSVSRAAVAVAAGARNRSAVRFLEKAQVA